MASPSSSSFRYSDALTVVGISLCTAVLCETISWLLIYRTSSYKSLRSSIDKASKKLDSMKTPTTSSTNPTPSSSAITKKSNRSKKIDRVETSLKESTRDLSLSKFKSGGVVALVLFVVFGMLNSMFEGRAVAKLPFQPVSLVYKMSHRGIRRYRLLDGVPLLLVLDEHQDQSPEVSRVRAPKGGWRGAVPDD